MRTSALAVASLLFLSSCVLRTGTKPPEIEALLDASGRMVTYTFRNEARGGELLGLRNDSAFILTSNQIYAVSADAVLSKDKRPVEWQHVSSRVRIDELRRDARYPMGISERLEAALLAKLNQGQVHR